MTRLILHSVLLIAALAISGPSRAHHGFAVQYDVGQRVRIEGLIREVSYRNPHSVIKVSVESAENGSVIWTCETQASSLLARKGITAASFPIGAPIVIEGSKARNSADRCEIGSMLLPDGERVVLRSVEGRADVAVNTAAAARSAESIFGRWILDSFSGAPVTPGFMANVADKGHAANAGYDGSTDDPTLRCSPVNPVRAMFAPGTPTEILKQDDRVIIRHEFMDTSRIVHLDASAADSPISPDEMGYSTGQLDRGRLSIETTNFAPGVLLTHVKDSGVLHSDRMTLHEELSVDAESGELIYRWEASDPEYFTRPIGGQLALSATELMLETYDCKPQTSLQEAQ